MPNRLDDFPLALAHQQAGRLAEAEAIYQAILKESPRHPQTHLFLGLLKEAQHDVAGAEASYRRALEALPDYPDAHFALANLLLRTGDAAAARASYQQALAARPDFYPALVGLASLLRGAGDVGRARDLLRRATQVEPRLPNAWFVLGNLESQSLNWKLSADCYQTALRIKPFWPDAEARLGLSLQALGRIDDAIPHYRRAVEMAPGHAEAQYNLGTALAERGDLAQARQAYHAAAQANPRHLGAQINLGAAAQAEGDLEQALVHYNRAIEIDPASAEAHYNRALVRLTRGDLLAGWEDYDWRQRLPGFPMRHFDAPAWQGEPLADTSLLVHAEQGLGDTLQFIRHLSQVGERSANVAIQVQKPLVPLLTQSGYAVVGDDVAPPKFDVQLPLLSLPQIFDTSWETIPADIPYLRAAPEDVATWKQRLSKYTGLRVGIAWQGRGTHSSDRARSIPLTEFAPLAGIGGVHLISLQKHDGISQLKSIRFPVERLDDLDEPDRPFLDTAAVIENLDLVITADTAVGHLAGALGARVWLALNSQADWRWGLERADTPWYPSTRLFRQTTPGDWADVFRWMATELVELALAKNA